MVVAGTYWTMMGCAVTTVRESFMLAVVMGRARNWRFGIAVTVLTI